MTKSLETGDPVRIGERLRIARTKAGITQEIAAEKLGMARTTLLAIEKGDRRLRGDELRQIALLYRVSVNALLRPQTLLVSLAPRFRALPARDKSKADDAANLLNDLAAAQVELEEILGLSFRPNYPNERPIVPGDIREQAEDAAMEIRHKLGIGLAPITDLVTLLEMEFGIRIFIRPLASSSISGLFVFDEQIGACILLNKNHPRERRAITAAHELAHLIASRNQPDLFENDTVPQSREERFASAFSFALLMPASLIRRRFRDLKIETGKFSPRHLILLAHQFGVSEEALCRRLEDLSLFPSGTWDALRDRGFSGEAVRSVLGDRSEQSDSSVPPRLWFMAAEAFRRGLLSEGQIARMLRADRLEVRTMLDTLGVEDWDEFEPLPAV